MDQYLFGTNDQSVCDALVSRDYIRIRVNLVSEIVFFYRYKLFRHLFRQIILARGIFRSSQEFESLLLFYNSSAETVIPRR